MTSTSSRAETPRAEARLGLNFGRTSDAMPVPIRPESRIALVAHSAGPANLSPMRHTRRRFVYRPLESPELRKSIRSIVRSRRLASINAPRMARSPQASAGPITLSSKASINSAVRMSWARPLIVFVMREVRADNQQRLVGPNLSDSCGNGTG